MYSMTRKKLANGLTQQQEDFCLAYADIGIGYKALVKAYPNTAKWTRASADSYVQKLLCKKYFVSKISYQKLLIKNIIYDDKRRLVSVFKEQLIINDISEYMKKFYKRKESRIKLRKYFELYDKYSRIFPNYTPLIESKYIYMNIHRKQKVIDLQQNSNKNNKIKNK